MLLGLGTRFVQERRPFRSATLIKGNLTLGASPKKLKIVDRNHE